MPQEESKQVEEAQEDGELARKTQELDVGGTTSQEGEPSEASPHAALIDKMSIQQLANIVAQNPSVRRTLDPSLWWNPKALKDALKKIPGDELVTTAGEKSNDPEDMANHKFWITQPVTHYDSKAGPSEGKKQAKPDGQIMPVIADKVPSKPNPLIDGFEWSELDLTNEAELEEVRALLSAHYVEDDESLFRFNYSASTLRWALLAPRWLKLFHLGVRASKSRKLVAFISSTPLHLRARAETFVGGEVNFLCIHKKLRLKRLAPVLIQEIVRRNYRQGIPFGTYTGGTVLPTPIASCRYFHRALDWKKLHDCGFSPMPVNSTELRQVAKYKLPTRTSTQGLRPLEDKDIKAVAGLLDRYLKLMEFTQEFDEEETRHWLLDPGTGPKAPDRVVYTYVVEDRSGKVTDFFSFYCLESTIINAQGASNVIKAAYLFYYATEAAFQDDEKVLADRLNALIKDALILAKQANFDVFNALTLMDNPLFLEKQLFGAGDGQLHYYLFNYHMAAVQSGVDGQNHVDKTRRRGVGLVML